MKRWLTAAVFIALIAPPASPQQPRGVARIKAGLDRLGVLGSALMIAAHPDDENTALLAYFARGRHLRTAYLSLTRGEGGQNLIGSEQAELMGVIRTQELLAARRIDGAEQYFTRAIDFGFSKTAEETLAAWGREQTLADVVWVIRRFQPDVIVLRFSGTPRDGHGHHQSSAILGKEAFHAAADPKRFPEQLKWVGPWQARRLLYNVFAFGPQMEREAASAPDRLEIDTGDYDPLLGYSYGEIAGLSRSMHRSQGMGAAERRGSQKNYLTLVAGEPASGDVMDGVDTTWNRVPGGEAITRLLEQARNEFDIERPSQVLPWLARARDRIAKIEHPWAAVKLRETDELIAEAAGLWLDASATPYAIAPGQELKLTITALNRSKAPVSLRWVKLEGMAGAGPPSPPESQLEFNRPATHSMSLRVPADHPYSQPYWLRKPASGASYTVERQDWIGRPESDPALTARFGVRVLGLEFELERPVIHRYVDRVRGELTRPLVVAPPVGVGFPERSLLFPENRSRSVEVHLRAQSAGVSGDLRLELPPGWSVSPDSVPFRLAEEGEIETAVFEVTPPAQASRAALRAVARTGGVEVRSSIRVIDYEHIPPQTVFPPAQVSLVRADVKLLARNIGYVMGAGDDVPQALRQMGATVTLLGPEDLAQGDLGRFDAIVTGVRAYNVRKDLRASQQRLMDYVSKGGTVVVQYNVLEGGFFGGNPKLLERIGPYPLRVGRERVAMEDAPLRPVQPDHILLQAPNRIQPADYDHWIQERGLYFATDWDKRYQPIWECNDPGERPLAGGTLYARHGRGVYVFTALAWFRQLPAGVPGAYRIFANLLSAGKVAE